MTFSLPGFDQWSSQIVMLGSLLVLEALKDNLKLTTALKPMDFTFSRAHTLISRPSCALVTAEARH